MSRGAQLSDRLTTSSVFANVRFLRQYDDYILDCTDATFSFHLMQWMVKAGLGFTGVPIGTSQCLVRFAASSEVERRSMVEFFKTGESRLLRHIKFPWL